MSGIGLEADSAGHDFMGFDPNHREDAADGTSKTERLDDDGKALP
jgi:hypothetical protein